MSEVSCLALRDLLERASQPVRNAFAKSVSVSLKADATPVTEVDLHVNQILQAGLRELHPTAGWLSEESADSRDRLNRDDVWIVDPLDGTKEFLRKIPEFAISVGLVRNGEPFAGAVVNPIQNQGGVWCADEGAPTFWGLDPQRPGQTPDAWRVLVSRSEHERGEVRQHGLITRTWIPVGSVAYKLLLSAAGTCDAFVTFDPKSEWDICGGCALLKGAGMIYRRFDGRPLVFNQPVPRVESGAFVGRPKNVEVLEKLISQSKTANSHPRVSPRY